MGEKEKEEQRNKHESSQNLHQTLSSPSPTKKEHKDQMSHTSKNNVLADRDISGWMSVLMGR